jgi:para-aminobenzoate synthetase / 4-amino-4-deoxychorismate lyase
MTSTTGTASAIGLLADLRAPYVLLEDRLTPSAPALLYREPADVIRCDDPDALDEVFARIEDGMARGLHAAGLLSYELGYALEPRLASRMPARRAVPLLWLGLFEAPQAISAAALDDAFGRMPPPPPITGLRAGHDRAEHIDKVRHILDLIAAGEIYQANLTFPMRFHYRGDPLALYAALRVRQPVAHGGVASLGATSVLSVSPELWIDVAGDLATTRPMKGTVARGMDAAADEAAKRILLADPKQRAENLMIVDLLRNDLARISTPGTVRVPALFTVETYPSFHTLTSTITASLRPGVGLRQRIAALFPCGSIVGAPKIRASEVIRSLEPQARGFYTGALGRIAPNGDMGFNVAIRTAVIASDGEARYGVGGGIVADSDPSDEYDEALLKARVLSELAADFDLIETFRWSGTGGFVRLRLHLDRLAGSAHQLGFELDRPGTEATLAGLDQEWSGREGDRRVRLLLRRTGETAITHEAIAPPLTRPLRVGIADHRLDPADPYLRHKTTRRAIYDAAFNTAATLGQDEALFLNRRGQVAESSRNNLFAEIGGRLMTPPLSCGLLPGILRGSLLATGEAVEAGLVLTDLQTARVLYLGNSLHGLREMVLA